METQDDFKNYLEGESEGYISDDDEDGNSDDNTSQKSEEPEFFNDGGTEDDNTGKLLTNEQEVNYTILSEDEIWRRQAEAVTTVTNFLCVSETEAGILLRHLKWSVSSINDEWFTNEGQVRRFVGLDPVPAAAGETSARFTTQELDCSICLETHPVSKMKATPNCGHYFCSNCWWGYIHNAINTGLVCLTLRCAHPSCGASIGEDTLLSYADEADRSKYTQYLLRSYVENNRKAKWCPSPRCEYAVEVSSAPAPGYSHVVVCKCCHTFCWNCLEEPHRPVDCEAAAKWKSVLTNANGPGRDVSNQTSPLCSNCKEGLGASGPCTMCWGQWGIMTNLKPCPKCKRPIEKDDGCKHMTCMPPCNFEFCWICLDSWSSHTTGKGGYRCYQEESSVSQFTDLDLVRAGYLNSWDYLLKDELVLPIRQPVRVRPNSWDDLLKKDPIRGRLRGSVYHDQWLYHEMLRQRAFSHVQNRVTEEIELLSRLQHQPAHQFNFLREAWIQIIDCRQILKYTYVYGYFLPDDGGAKRQFFNYLQMEAEARVSRLHHCAEKELEAFGDPKSTKSRFDEYRSKLVQLTSVTGAHLEEIVRVLENGLEDVVDQS